MTEPCTKRITWLAVYNPITKMIKRWVFFSINNKEHTYKYTNVTLLIISIFCWYHYTIILFKCLFGNMLIP